MVAEEVDGQGHVSSLRYVFYFLLFYTISMTILDRQSTHTSQDDGGSSRSKWPRAQVYIYILHINYFNVFSMVYCNIVFSLDPASNSPCRYCKNDIETI